MNRVIRRVGLVVAVAGLAYAAVGPASAVTGYRTGHWASPEVHSRGFVMTYQASGQETDHNGSTQSTIQIFCSVSLPTYLAPPQPNDVYPACSLKDVTTGARHYAPGRTPVYYRGIAATATASFTVPFTHEYQVCIQGVEYRFGPGPERCADLVLASLDVNAHAATAR